MQGKFMDKNYYSANEYFVKTFGSRLIKLSIDAGFTCPNRDGTKSFGGCVFCSEKGSGDFTNKKSLSGQLEEQMRIMSSKWKEGKFAAYFQAFTNTYADIGRLRQLYSQVLKRDDIHAVFIATRPDCIDESIASLLESLVIRYQKPIFIELGLQTSRESTGRLVNRQFVNNDFEKACDLLNAKKIQIICHIILGLPHETKADILESVKFACGNGISGIKLHTLYVLKNTALVEMYINNSFKILSFEEYIDIVISCLEIMPRDVVIHRLTGDGVKEDVIAPEWSKNKRRVLNAINSRMKRDETYQGRLYKN